MGPVLHEREPSEAGMRNLSVPGVRGRTSAAPAAAIARAVRDAIVPHLLHRKAWRNGRVQSLQGPALFSRTQIEDFARLLMRQQAEVVTAWLQALRADGVSIEDLYCDLMAPAVRFMGALWQQDRACFTEVTVAVGLLQQVMRETNQREGSSFHEPPTRRILLLGMGANTHVLGLMMVADLFTRAGWHVECNAAEPASASLDCVVGEWYDVVGFSVADRMELEWLDVAIERVRRLSRNRRLGIIVGGSVFTVDPLVLGCPLADVVVTDGRMAVDAATRLVLQGTPPP